MSKQFKTLTVLNYAMAAVFLLSAAVQYNDPDPLRWMAIYFSAASACVLHIAGRASWPLTTVIAAIAIVWAGALAPRVTGSVAVTEVFASVSMKNERVEEAREMGGLIIVTVWMTVLTYNLARRS